MAQRLNDATMRTPAADGETIGRNGTVGNSDRKRLGWTPSGRNGAGQYVRSRERVKVSLAADERPVRLMRCKVKNEECKVKNVERIHYVPSAFFTLQFALFTLN